MIFAILFVMSFQVGPGPVTWLYIAEICNNKATSMGTIMTQVLSLAVSIITPFWTATEFGTSSMWMTYAVLSVFGLMFCVFLMKETRGLSEQQVKALY